jgi:hypothetical protein
MPQPNAKGKDEYQSIARLDTPAKLTKKFDELRTSTATWAGWLP